MIDRSPTASVSTRASYWTTKDESNVYVGVFGDFKRLRRQVATDRVNHEADASNRSGSSSKTRINLSEYAIRSTRSSRNVDRAFARSYSTTPLVVRAIFHFIRSAAARRLRSLACYASTGWTGRPGRLVSGAADGFLLRIIY